jgi:hypothetical protein
MSEREELLKALAALTEAVNLNTEALKSRPAPAAAAAANGLKMPFGRSKGQPISGAPVNDLKWVGEKIAADLDAPDKAKWRDNNLQILTAINAALAASGVPGVGPAAAPGAEDIPF